jgi:sec-independent protein translocase protein TatA
MSAMPFNVGPLELVVVLIIALVVFGPKRLPELGHSLGKGIREFRSSVSGEDKDDEKDEKVHEIEEAPTQAKAETAEPVEGEVVSEKRA